MSTATAITFSIHSGANVEHYAATTPEAATVLRDTHNGSACGFQFEKLSDTTWHIFTHGQPATLGGDRQHLGTATLGAIPAGLVAFEGCYMPVPDAMALAGF